VISLEIPKTPEENLLLGKWVEQRVDGKYTDFQCMAAFEPGHGIVAVVLFHNYRKTDIEIVLAAEPGKRWAYRDMMNAAMSYPFLIGCHRVTAFVRKDNPLSRKLVEQVGFKKEGKIRRASKDKTDLLVYGLLPEEYRFQRKEKNVRKAA
jgi:RimJ/RimL family protein N-acetyltransferase